MFTVDSLHFDRWMVTCPLLLGVYKPLVQVTSQALRLHSTAEGIHIIISDIHSVFP